MPKGWASRRWYVVIIYVVQLLGNTANRGWQVFDHRKDQAIHNLLSPNPVRRLLNG